MIALSENRSRIASLDLDGVHASLVGRPPAEIVRWAADRFGDGLVMTSSFGAQAAVMLHLVTRVAPRIPVIFIDTGYHFPETYAFCDELTRRLELNLKVYQSPISPAWMESRIGRLWEIGATDDERAANLVKYDQLRKVEPQRRALRELSATACMAGNRRQQTDHRAALRHVEIVDALPQVYPILTWSQKDVHGYLKEHGLPYHPLHDKGYKSIGDAHSTFPVGEGQHERAGRFMGLKQECGLHLPATVEEEKSREGSGL